MGINKILADPVKRRWLFASVFLPTTVAVTVLLWQVVASRLTGESDDRRQARQDASDELIMIQRVKAIEACLTNKNLPHGTLVVTADNSLEVIYPEPIGSDGMLVFSTSGAAPSLTEPSRPLGPTFTQREQATVKAMGFCNQIATAQYPQVVLAH